MTATYTLKWNQIFENCIRTLFSKEMIKCPRILSTSKRASVGDFPSKISAATDIAKGSQLYTSACFWTGKKLTMNSFTQFLYNAWTHFLFTRLRNVFKLSQIWNALLQKVSRQCPEASWSSWLYSFFIAR